MILESRAQQPNDHSYAQYYPGSSAAGGKRKAPCRNVTSWLPEIVRQGKSPHNFVPRDQLLPETALAIQKVTQTNIAALETAGRRVWPVRPPPSAGSNQLRWRALPSHRFSARIFWSRPPFAASRPSSLCMPSLIFPHSRHIWNCYEKSTDPERSRRTRDAIVMSDALRTDITLGICAVVLFAWVYDAF